MYNVSLYMSYCHTNIKQGSIDRVSNFDSNFLHIQLSPLIKPMTIPINWFIMGFPIWWNHLYIIYNILYKEIQI